MSGRKDSDGNAIGGSKGTSGSGKISPYNPSSGNRDVDWPAVDSTAIADAIDRITRNGDAILFARSMDGGVLVATVCAGSERIKFYAREGLEMTAHLVGITNALDQRSGR